MSGPPWLCVENDAIVIGVWVQPKASRNAIVGEAGGMLRVAVTAPAHDGKANAAVLALLAEAAGVAKSDAVLVSGRASRRKRVRLRGAAPQALLRGIGR